MTVANSFGSRASRAADLADSGRITRSADGTAWLVPSRSEAGRYYSVIKVNGALRCNCPDFLARGIPCQHIQAAAIVAKRESEKSHAALSVGREAAIQSREVTDAPSLMGVHAEGL